MNSRPLDQSRLEIVRRITDGSFAGIRVVKNFAGAAYDRVKGLHINASLFAHQHFPKPRYHLALCDPRKRGLTCTDVLD